MLFRSAYSADDVAFLVTMAEKRARGGDALAKTPPADRRQRTEASGPPQLQESITVTHQDQLRKTHEYRPTLYVATIPLIIIIIIYIFFSEGYFTYRESRLLKGRE